MVAFIEAFRDQFGVEPICRALRQAGVAISPSGYYAARARPPPARAVRDAALEKQILRVYKDSGERYGAWKVWDQLNREGIAVARCTVERLMRELGLRGVRRGGCKAAHDASRPVAGAAGGPGEPGLRAARAEPAVGRGLHLRGHLGGHRLHRVRDRRVLPADRRVAHRRQPQHRTWCWTRW